MYVLSSIDIPIVMDTTFGASPFTDIKRQGVEHMSAVKAAFGGRIPLVNLDQIPPVPLCFVLQLGHKLTPSYITDRFRERWVLDHVLHLQALDADRLVLTDQARGEFMQEVTATVSDAGMYLGNFFASLRTVLGSPFLLGVSPLRFRQLLLILVEEFGIANIFAIREYHEGLQAQISPDGSSSPRQVCNVLFYQDGHEVAVCTILGDGDTPWFGPIRQGTTPHDGEWYIHLSKCERVSIPLERIGGVGSRLLVTLLLELGVLGPPFKEIQKCLVEVSQGLLQGNRRDLTQPRILRLLLEVCQGERLVFVIEALLLMVEGIRLLAQGPVIEEAATAEGSRKNELLLVCWIDAVLVCSLLFHVYMVAYRGVNIKHIPQDFGAACIPIAEARGSYAAI